MFYRALINDNLPSNRVPAWSLHEHVAYMSTNGIARSVVSISTPGTNIFPPGSAAANAAVARLTNEFMFALAETYPERFSFAANIPLPYINESVVEARYVLEKLNASGIGLLSSHEGQYHGSDTFLPFYEYLDEKSVGIFYHPTVPLQEVDGALIPAYPSYGFVFAPFDFLFDTARNIMNMTAAHTMRRHQRLRFGFAHCAGAWASVADRYFSSPVYGSSESWEQHAKVFQTRDVPLLESVVISLTA
jgi:predicted TIM-barrel fold metal-dependent hydrolase